MTDSELSWTYEKFLDDIDFYVRIKNVNEYVAQFEAYRTCMYDNGKGYPYKFEYATDNGLYEYTADISKAEPLIKGYLKWDGCSDVEFQSYIHGCDGRDTYVNIGKLFCHIYDQVNLMIKTLDNQPL